MLSSMHMCVYHVFSNCFYDKLKEVGRVQLPSSRRKKNTQKLEFSYFLIVRLLTSIFPGR